MAVIPKIQVEDLLKLSCDDQFALATRLAANVGYVLAPEPQISDGPTDEALDRDVGAASGSSLQKMQRTRTTEAPSEAGVGSERSSPSETPAPFVEFGVGWAKVHFRREVTDQDRANLIAAISLSGDAVREAILREATTIMEECAIIADRYNDCGGDFIAQKIREAAAALPQS